MNYAGYLMIKSCLMDKDGYFPNENKLSYRSNNKAYTQTIKTRAYFTTI